MLLHAVTRNVMWFNPILKAAEFLCDNNKFNVMCLYYAGMLYRVRSTRMLEQVVDHGNSLVMYIQHVLVVPSIHHVFLISRSFIISRHSCKLSQDIHTSAN